MTSTLIPPLIGAFGLLVAVIIYGIVRRYDAGSAALVKIADAIHEGAMVFMKREYTMLAIFALVLLFGVYLTPGLGEKTAIVPNPMSIADELVFSAGSFLGEGALPKEDAR